MTRVPALPCPPLSAPLIVGRSVDLTRLDVTRHGASLFRAVGADPALWVGTPSGPFADEATFTGWLRDRTDRPGQALYAIIDKLGASPAAAGLFFLMHIDPPMGVVELGLVYGPSLSRRIGGTEAFFLVARHVLEEMGYRRLEWRCADTHVASKRAAARFGFTFEGVLRQAMWVKGESWDTAVYSLLDREWPAVGARLGAWLSPENFTLDGEQKRALSSFVSLKTS